MNSKEDSSLDEQPSYNSKYLEATQTNEKEGLENLHTKVQCQKQQLQHAFLEKNENKLLSGKRFVGYKIQFPIEFLHKNIMLRRNLRIRFNIVF